MSRSIPTVVSRSVPVVESRLVPTVESRSVPAVESRSVPTVESRSVPAVESRSVPAVESRSVPTVESRSVPSVKSRSVPVVMSRSVPTVESRSVPTVVSRSVPRETGLGYDGHVNESESLNNVVDNYESNEDDNEVNDRFKKSEGYHAVPPPYTGNYMPSRSDLSFVGLDSVVFKFKVKQSSMDGFGSAKVKRVNEDVHIRSLIDGKKIIVTEASIRRDLQLQDAEGTACLPNDTIFKELARMCTMASAIIYLANNQKFNFFKYIFDNMVFANMKREGKGFSGIIAPLFETMMVQAPEEVGEGLELQTDTHHTPIFTQPSSSQPQKKKKSKRKRRKETEVSHTKPQTKESVPTTFNDPLPSETKTAQAKEIADLKKRVKKLERKKKSKTSGLKRLWKVGSIIRVESSEDKESLGNQEDASKQRRMIDNIDQDVEITLVDETQGRMNEEDMFRVNDLDVDEVIVDVTAGENVEQSTKDAEKEVSTADPITTAGELVTTAEDDKVTIVDTTP
nr:hypothetical protein [Tanacetum cinerariifolium]